MEFAELYLRFKDIFKAITALQERHVELINWNIELF